MSVGYKPVTWTLQKKYYDLILWLGILLYLVCFSVVALLTNSAITMETLIIRGTGTLALILLHIILLIGPLSRINRKFLPLLYNRRHLGVSFFLVALVHSIFNILQFHAGGDENTIASVFISNSQYQSLTQFPFQVLGFFALIVFFIMAATSHDFWLKNLSPKVWKLLHMLVYLAYGLVLMHVMLGVVQSEKSNLMVVLLGAGLLTLITLHLFTGYREVRKDIKKNMFDQNGYVRVGKLDSIQNNRAKIVRVKRSSIAVFRYGSKLSAISNVCKHQNGSLGEGKVIDGCITCPWHGYQYQPHNGCSPPPFTEKVSTYQLKVVDNEIWVDPNPQPEGTEIDPVIINM